MKQKSTHNTCDTQRSIVEMERRKLKLSTKLGSKSDGKMKDVHYMDRYVISSTRGHLFWAYVSSPHSSACFTFFHTLLYVGIITSHHHLCFYYIERSFKSIKGGECCAF
jgi:hypothetical protein